MDIIAKPENSQWTDDQWQAIARQGENILVAAAAGSGKTAVLVERIIRKICSEDEPINVDQLLVATFTKAAAAEMRERIREALEKQLELRPEAEHLRRQLALMNRASITTLHSFCLEVIQRYFQLIPLDPAFRIANETEAELLRQEVLEELFEDRYASEPEESGFRRLVDWFSGERSDEAMFRLVQGLYDFSRSHPWPDEWLRAMAASFGVEDVKSLGRSAWAASIMADVRLALNGAAGLLEQAMQIAGLPGGPVPYIENLTEDIKVVSALRAAAERQPWETMHEAFAQAEFGKLKACRGDQYDKELQERVKQLREQAKKQIGELKEQLFRRPPEAFLAEMQTMGPLMAELSEFVIEFGSRYEQAKRDKGFVDFSDLEHYCLKILRHPDSTFERTLPSAAALEYQTQFAEVLLDEYQDTNMVQEAIVELISRPGAGNRFMVGDVKQSIYRFRLAEPGLFLQKYKQYPTVSEGVGLRIDLARNFRSRQEIVDSVNCIFRQTMNESVAEISYDERAELVCGANYPVGEAAFGQNYAAELLLIERGGSGDAGGEDERDISGGSEPETEEEEDGQGAPAKLDKEELETARLEARAIAARIRSLTGENGKPFQVFDKQTKSMRPVSYRDIVILLRATQQWAPLMIEQLRLEGIPAYAELNTGYFQATEVEVVLSLLQTIDNPQQDIPLAGVLRSPMYGLSAEELAQIRIQGKGMPFYDAVRQWVDSNAIAASGGAPEDARADLAFAEAAAAAVDAGAATQRLAADEWSRAAKERAAFAPVGADTGDQANLSAKLTRFLRQLERWRDEARQGSLAELIWRIYRETGYYDWVGGLPGGTQRQANLRALYDRARQYESTSLRGLFRFLRFIERMRDSGGDLGTAKALGEQEDVVRIMTIHKSKGLEFPVVFVAGLNKRFNQQDISSAFLTHKQLGFGPKFVDQELRISYPTLPSLAIARQMKMELLAEEMRVLYVALTRPKEKLYLVGTVKNMEKTAQTWGQALDRDELLLPDYMLAKGRSYLDWIGPSLIRHRDAEPLRRYGGMSGPGAACLAEDRSLWRIAVLQAGEVQQWDAAGAAAVEQDEEYAEKLHAVINLEPYVSAPASAPDATDPLAGDDPAIDRAQIARRLEWTYPHRRWSGIAAKSSVSEMKSLLNWEEEEGISDLLTDMAMEKEARQEAGDDSFSLHLRRPRFMEKRKLTPAERGTVYHLVMQHMPIAAAAEVSVVERTMDELMLKKMLTQEQREAIDASSVAAFFASEIGRRMARADWVKREVPFSCGLPAQIVYPQAALAAQDDLRAQMPDHETVLIQGVIDCIFESEGSLALLDYKTDRIVPGGESVQAAAERHRFQLELYAQAIGQIWKRPVREKIIYFFDGCHIVSL